MSLLQSTELMALGKSVFLWGRLTPGHWSCTHSLKNFWTCDIAEWTRPFWVRAGFGRIRLSRTFRRPFANLSPISRLNSIFSENNVYARVAFIICVNQGANAILRTWDNTKLKPFVSIDKEKQMSTSLYTYICQSCIDAIYSPNHARKTAKHEYYSITSMFINSGIQTFREPFAVFRHCSKNTHLFRRKLMSELCLDRGSHVYTFAYPPLPTAVLASSAQESGQQGMMSARFKH